jgi:hypothetical protein
MRTGVASLCALLVLAACGPDGGGDVSMSGGLAAICTPPPTAGGTLRADATLADAAGEWRLTVVAEEGEAAGARQEATLTLVNHEPAMRRIIGFDGEPMADFSAPLHGSTSLDLGALGALEMGGLDSTDPAAPGVGVYEGRAADGSRPASIVLRLGSEANRRDNAALDGGTSVLRVLRVGDDGFAGTWRSQVAAQTVAAGWFCAMPAGG